MEQGREEAAACRAVGECQQPRMQDLKADEAAASCSM